MMMTIGARHLISEVSRMNLKRATKTKACCNCKHCKPIPKDEHLSSYCEKRDAQMGYIYAMGMRCDDWEEHE